MNRRQAIGLASLAALVLLAPLLAAPVQAQTGYEALADWSALPDAKTGFRPGLASSYDRGDDGSNQANHDYDQFDCCPGPVFDGNYKLVRQIDGPGVISRIWLPHLIADRASGVRITLDQGTSTAFTIDTNTDALLHGSYGPGPQFRGPLIDTSLGGSVSYEPIPFQHSARIEMTNPSGSLFYQVGYQRLPATAIVPTFNGSLTAAQQAARARAVDQLTHLGLDPAGPDPAAATVALAAQSIPAGATLTLAALSGSGQVRALDLRLRGPGVTPTDAQLDGLRLRVRYDGAAANAIDVPVSHFFGVGHNRADYKSLPLGVADDGGYYSYWPMPYKSGATVELYNATAAPVSLFGSSVESVARPAPAGVGELHAVWQEEVTAPGQTYHNLMRVTGSGHYVGNLLYQRAGPGIGGTLEGDDVIRVDGGASVLHGTGMEDAYNGGFYYNTIPGYDVSDHGDTVPPGTGPFTYHVARAFHGLLSFYQDSYNDQYRWLTADPVPFSTGLDVNMENFGKYGGNTWGSTAFYYLTAPGAPGDATGDGRVDGSDLAALAEHYGQSVGRAGEPVGDFNGDGVVDVADLGILGTNYGYGMGLDSSFADALAAYPGLTGAVPEPGGTAALGAALAGLVMRRPRRRGQIRGSVDDDY